MPHTIARLRQGILILAGLLVAVLIGFFVYAHYRIRRFEKDLPAKLGANIQQTANSYTYSQSRKGHTLFTIHASKLIQYKQGGNATLHDVAITLYGPPGSNRVDKIYGADFSYNPKDQIVTAQGEVGIDLQGFGRGREPSSSNTIHVTTSGLVFNQKTGEADTTQHTEFAFPKASGSSTGAHYNSKTGVLVLDSSVELTTMSGGGSAIIHAAHARVERETNQAFLVAPQTDFRSEKGSSDNAVIGFRDDGSAEQITAQGHVRLVTANGGVLTAPRSVTELNDKSQLMRTDLDGGINFVSDAPAAQMRGSAQSGTLSFGDNSALQHAQFRGGVNFAEKIPRLANDPGGSASRRIQAATLDVDFAPGPGRKKTVARKAIATGNASVHFTMSPSKGKPQSTDISGDKLIALLTPNGKAVEQLDGSGDTRFVNVGTDGSSSTSTGNTLHVTFAATPGAKKAHDGQQAAQIESAIQDGNVVLTQTPARKSGSPAPATLTAWAQHSEYHATDQILRLTGNPRLRQGTALQMTAGTIDYHRDSGDTVASGGVKATYASQSAGPTLSGNGPVHVIADHALLRHASGASIFYGAGSTNARIWQGGDSILAPVIELTRTPQTLKAYGAASGTGDVVEANLTSVNGPNHRQSVMRVRSHTLLYSDQQRRADFHGEVSATDSSGTIHADDAQVFLARSAGPEAHGAQKNPSPKSQSQVERIVASGNVVFSQPGRKGRGDRLVYTASDGRYVLTGSPARPPRIEDVAKGVTSGAKLIFDSQDDSVVVSGGQSSAVTETRAPH